MTSTSWRRIYFKSAIWKESGATRATVRAQLSGKKQNLPRIKIRGREYYKTGIAD
jgi:hypothetical protein